MDTSSQSRGHAIDEGEREGIQALERDLDARLRTARPRLVVLARTRGASAEDADEIAQETLVIAWRQLARLRDPARFESWLDGICRKVSLRRARGRSHELQRLVPIGQSPDDGASGVSAADAVHELADPATDDLAEDLYRGDLQTLVDSALAHLSEQARKLVELCYLAELPQREAAEQLGLSLSAVEARLHRARRELRAVLSGPLHGEAEALGLVTPGDVGAGWRESREWCFVCGRRRLRGTFESMPDGRINLRMRCPECSTEMGADVVNTYGAVPLEGLRSFRPALRRVYQSDVVRHLTSAEPFCPFCHGPARRWVERQPAGAPMHDTYYIVSDCPSCGVAGSWLANVALTRPATWAWISQRTRYVLRPDVAVTFGGVPAVRIRLEDVTAPARLDVFVEPRSLAVLGVVEG